MYPINNFKYLANMIAVYREKSVIGYRSSPAPYKYFVGRHVSKYIIGHVPGIVQTYTFTVWRKDSVAESDTVHLFTTTYRVV